MSTRNLVVQVDDIAGAIPSGALLHITSPVVKDLTGKVLHVGPIRHPLVKGRLTVPLVVSGAGDTNPISWQYGFKLVWQGGSVAEFFAPVEAGDGDLQFSDLVPVDPTDPVYVPNTIGMANVDGLGEALGGKAPQSAVDQVQEVIDGRLSEVALTANIEAATARKVSKVVPSLAPATRAHEFDARLSVYNAESPWLRKARAYIAKGLAGSRVQILAMGHSYMAGSGAVPGKTDQIRRFELAIKARLGEDLVRSAWAPIRCNEIRDARYSAISGPGAGQKPDWGWDVDFNPNNFAGTTVQGATLTCTSDEPTTVVEIGTLRNSAPFNVEIDGGAPTLVSPLDSSYGARLVTFAGLPNTTHSVKITTTTTGEAYFAGCLFRNASGIEVYNFGYGGSYAADWLSLEPTAKKRTLATSYASPSPIILLEMDTNDVVNNVPVATWKTNMQTILTSHLGSNQCVLLIVSIDAAGHSAWPAYYQAAYELADQYNIPLFDQTQFSGGSAAMQADGLKANDLHPNAAGYATFAQGLAAIYAP